MKKLAIAALVVVAGCRAHATTAELRAGGAAAPREAIERFIGAAKAQDYDGMSLAFGSADGPARAVPPKGITRKQRRSWPNDLKQREFIMMRCLRHDRVQIGTETPTPTGARVYGVQVWFKDLTATTNFTVVQGPNERWYVLQFEPDPLQRICASI